MALRGGNLAEVDGLLRAAGQHRPPEGLGVAPFPAFDAIERSAEDDWEEVVDSWVAAVALEVVAPAEERGPRTLHRPASLPTGS